MALLRPKDIFDFELDKPVPGMLLNLKNTTYCCIYRVPNCIRQVNPEAYTPQLIIIGPLHHSLKSQALKSRGDITNTKSMGYLSMERHKKFYLEEFTLRVGGEQTIDELKAIIREEKMIIRASYSESTAWIKTPQFLGMILRDSVFIIEFLLRSHNPQLTGPGDPLIDEPCLGSTVEDDLFLLENQLPYFILERLFNPIIPRLLQGYTMRRLIVESSICQGEINDNSTFRHFTDMLRLVHVETLPHVPLRECNTPIEHTYVTM